MPEARAAVAIDPSRPRHHLVLGELYLRLERSAEALESFSIASRIAPGAVQSHLGRAAAALELGEPATARAALATARELEPDHPVLLDLARRLDPEGVR